MAISTITSAGIATDTLTAVDIADDAIGTAELANDVVISTSGNITTTGKLSTPSIVQTDAQNLSGTYSTHELIMGKTFTLTGDLTVNANLVLANMSATGSDITIQPDSTARTVTSTGGTGILEGVPSALARTTLTGMSGVMVSSVTGIPAAGITGVLPVGVTGGSGLNAVNAANIAAGVLPVGVTGGSGLTALGTVTVGNISHADIVYPAGHVIKVQLDSYNTEASTTSISTYITAVISGSYTIVNASSTLHVSGFFHVSNVGNSCFVKVEYSTDDFSSDTDLFSSGSFVLRNNNSSVINQLASFSDKHTHGLSVGSTIKYRTVVNFGGGSGTVITNEGGGYSRIQIMEVI